MLYHAGFHSTANAAVDSSPEKGVGAAADSCCDPYTDEGNPPFRCDVLLGLHARRCRQLVRAVGGTLHGLRRHMVRTPRPRHACAHRGNDTVTDAREGRVPQRPYGSLGAVRRAGLRNALLPCGVCVLRVTVVGGVPRDMHGDTIPPGRSAG